MNEVNNQTINQVQNVGVTQQPNVGSLTIIRPQNFVGCLIDYDVYVDGFLVGNVPNGQTRVFPLYYGNHVVEIKHGFNKGSQQILINDHDRNLVFNCPIKMGLITNKILFELVNISS